MIWLWLVLVLTPYIRLCLSLKRFDERKGADVGFWRLSRGLPLNQSITGFDPERTSPSYLRRVEPASAGLSAGDVADRCCEQICAGAYCIATRAKPDRHPTPDKDQLWGTTLGPAASH
jgi:hypothetical protein